MNDQFSLYPVEMVVCIGKARVYRNNLIEKLNQNRFDETFKTIHMKKTQITLLLVFLLATIANAQQLSQTVRGTVLDKDTQMPLLGATVIRISSSEQKGTITDINGNFVLSNVPVGRHSFKISYIGYMPYVINEVYVSSGKEVFLLVELVESVTKLDEITVKPTVQKDESLNYMASVSARVFSIEEAKRYAGGFDDPTRLVSAFAGVSAPQVESNGISVRGNAPSMVQYRMEGLEIENANHFEGGDLLGGGFVSLFSSHMLGNSDFLTGAFPAEYGNALSAVFDMNMRVGNNSKNEHAVQVGIMGVDVASEGPFRKGGNASYLFNYRYSTFGLLQGLLPEGEGLPVYQDFNFKTNFPTKYGVFTLWGSAAIDDFNLKAKTDSAEWNMEIKREEINADFLPVTTGLTHKYLLKNNAYINTSLLYEYYKRTDKVQWLNNDLLLYDESKIDYRTNNFTVSSIINKKFSAKHTNRTGFVYKLYNFDINNYSSTERLQPMKLVNSSNGNSALLRAFSQSKTSLSNRFTINTGVHFQMFTLNNKYTVEPRLGLQYKVSDRATLSAAYGHHSKLQKLEHYFVLTADGDKPNEDLDFTKAQHFVLGFDYKLTSNTRIKIEPYYQILSDIPVIENSSFAVINLQDSHSFYESMINDGTGTNIGVDFTLERFLDKGFYYLATASIFDSKYTGGDGIERNTIFNGNYVANVLGGKEWTVGKMKNNQLGLNGRFYLIGGSRTSPVNEVESIIKQRVIYDDSKLYEEKFPATSRLDITVSYTINKPKHSSTFSLQLLNALGSVITTSQEFNYVDNKVEEFKGTSMLPNLSWKIEF
jgi:hypothetical protein